MEVLSDARDIPWARVNKGLTFLERLFKLTAPLKMAGSGLKWSSSDFKFPSRPMSLADG